MTTNSPNPVDGDVQAQPVAWAHRLVNKRNGTIHPWVYGSKEKEPSEGDIFRIEVMPLYTTPPAPILRPVILDKGVKREVISAMGAEDALWISRSSVINLLHSLGYEVKA
ncbi:hypothetical protein MXM51_01535 [Pantoea stewartii]|uniref:hypothetical protein n=1 Tax=Pantoea stewartii TaxID=66269 RepID=UPI002DBA8BA4|nr:hypothetical protein [Pantoea stewartii]MEB6533232.1 hypothetical protein [Pantoea stewartii]